MKRISIIFVALGSLFTGSLVAQDHHFSQYDAASMVLNPALTGMFGAQQQDYEMGLQHRDQWRGLTSQPFTRSAVWLGMNHRERMGFGGHVTMDRAGGGFSTLNAMVSGSYNIVNGQFRRQHQLTVGLQLGLIQRSFDPGAHTFDNQYTGTAQVFDTGHPSGEENLRNSLLGLDANMGVSYVNMDKKLIARPFGGLMIAHITRARQSFTDFTDRTPMRFAAHAGAEIDASSRVKVTPSVLVMGQAGVGQVNAGVLGAYALADDDHALLLGVGYRTADALILQAGMRYRTVSMRIAYDRTISTLRNYTGGMGGMELALSYGGTFRRKK
jgi:type IX secretion system PorP/SprF family membrane protein